MKMITLAVSPSATLRQYAGGPVLGADFILDGLAREGIDHIFMVPGGLVDPFLPALGRQSVLILQL